MKQTTHMLIAALVLIGSVALVATGTTFALLLIPVACIAAMAAMLWMMRSYDRDGGR